MAVPTWTAEAPATRNSIASSADQIPPMPIIGRSGRARAISQTIRSATGLIAGPLRPPISLARIGLRLRQSMAMPLIVLTRLTASAPPSAAARAMATTSVTFGVSLAINGNGPASRQRRTTRVIADGSIPRSSPWLTFGHERFSSTADKPGSSFSRPTIATNPSSSSPATLAITTVPTVRR